MKSQIAILIFSLTMPLQAQIDSSLVQLLEQHIHPLTITEHGFESGEATDLLMDAVKTSQFILIGEQHGIQEIGQFTRHIYSVAQEQDYRHLALEVSPFMAENLEQRVKQGIDSLMAFDRRFPYSIPFYGNNSDFPMLQHGLEKEGSDFWGLDQVFIVEPRSLFGKLEQLATTQDAKALAKKYRQMAEEKVTAAMQSGKFDEIILFQLSEDDFGALRQSFPKEKHLLPSQIIDQMQKTRNIYQAWFDGRGYDNNYERIQLMKDNFFQYYHSAVMGGEAIPKVLFKFGSNHMQRGLTPVNVFDLGNMANELATQNGLHSVHILINGLKGETHHPLQGKQAFDQWEDLDPHFQIALEGVRPSSNWQLIDLRPLRQMRLKEADADLKRIIFGFDFWIVVPEAKALDPF